MNRSEQINELVKALSKAQAEMQNPSFDQMNPHFRNKFASLAAVRNAVIPVLSKHGLSLTQELTNGERGPRVLTLISHESGQWMEFGPLEMPVAKGDAQGVGSAATYARRYSLMAVCVVVGDEDDDGNAAAASLTPQRQAAQKIVQANIKPDTGARESLNREQLQKADVVASIVTDAYTAGDIALAYRNWTDADLEAEEKIAAWSMLDSKLRSTLKKMKGESELGGQA